MMGMGNVISTTTRVVGLYVCPDLSGSRPVSMALLAFLVFLVGFT